MPNIVSILVPMYNVEHYIAKCSRSLFSQSHEACEFIFVDDASTDQTLAKLSEVIAEFPHLEERIKVVCHPTNQGVATARNSALDTATGSYILFVDADDWVEPDLIEKLYLRLIETGADISNVWCDSVTDDDGIVSSEPTVWMSSTQSHLKALLGQSHIVKNHVRGMLIKRSIFEQHALRFIPTVDFGEDFSILPQLIFYAEQLSTLGEYLYHYRVDNTTSYMSNISDKNIANYVAAFGIVERFIAAQSSAKQYRRALDLGRVNIKKWILYRGVNPQKYDGELFGSKRGVSSPIIRLYNSVVNTGNITLVKLFSSIVNLPLYIHWRVRSY